MSSHPAPSSATRTRPMRTCVGCRNRATATDLVRVVVAGSASPAEAVPDVRGRMPGRGAWLHPDLACLDLAVRRRAFPRALRHPGPLDLAAVRTYLEAKAGTDGDEPAMSAQQ